MITFYYGPRQIGKTTQAIDLFLQDPDNTLFGCINNDMCRHVSDMIRSKGYDDGLHRKYIKGVVNVSNLSSLCGKSYDRIILDEFDFVNSTTQRDVLYITESSCKDIVIFTTPSKLRDKKMYNYVIDMKKRYADYNVFYHSNKDVIEVKKMRDIKDMWFDVITRDNIRIGKVPIPDWWKLNKEESRFLLTGERYQLEVEGKLFAEDKIVNKMDLVSVQPLPMPSGLLFYFDYKYGSDTKYTSINYPIY